MSLKSVSLFLNTAKRFSTKPSSNNDILPSIVNRNPRNLERLRLERKPTGYGVDKHKVEFWHKLVLENHPKFISAKIVHNNNKVVVEASTKEWAFGKYLYSLKDKLAYIILAKVFAERCLESGIHYCSCFDNPSNEEELKINLFYKTLEEEGLQLKEPEYYNIYDTWRKPREKRPWTVLEEN